MKPYTLTSALSATLLISACANTGAGYQPITDGSVNANYQKDLAQCQELATQRSYLNDDTQSDALIGAGLGALAGLADDDTSDAEGAIAGAVVGGMAGGGASMLKTRDQRRDIVIRCLKGRGHNAVG